MKVSRRQGRERAFQLLFGCNFASVRGEDYLVQSYGLAKGRVTEDIQPDPFAWELVQGVLANQNKLDEIIDNFSQNWRLERIGKVELTILRVALFEMLFRLDVPLKVAINEAVELSKRYGDNRSRGFINGILDAVAKKIEAGELKKFGDQG